MTACAYVLNGSSWRELAQSATGQLLGHANKDLFPSSLYLADFTDFSQICNTSLTMVYF